MGSFSKNLSKLQSSMQNASNMFDFMHFNLSLAVCDHDRACGRGFSCDRHFGLCVPLRGEGHYCRRDVQCVRGLSCMFGKCHRSVPTGQEGARCKVDRDCGASMCCARHHGEQVCKRRLIRGQSCYVPDGGLAFSINQICPCHEGLLCRGNGASDLVQITEAEEGLSPPHMCSSSSRA
uniref:Dickkopf N-terminal cysteine-rich domain-containing protein n=1 Tax=Mola mola TaxID=94237 RepID=A0A3Q4BYT4_MOLML